MNNQEVARMTPDQTIDRYRADIVSVLPSHVPPDMFIRVARGAVRKNPKLMQGAAENPHSLVSALMEAARLGLEPGTNEFHLTPRRVKDDKGRYSMAVLGITGWQGEIELMYRAGAVSAVKAELVCENDEFHYQPGDDRPHHVIDYFGDRGEVRGAYAYAEMVGGGTSRVCIVGPAEIARARKSAATQAMWEGDDYPAMVRKTAVLRLADWVPTSAEYRREIARNAAEVARNLPTGPPPTVERAVVDTGSGEIIDAEVVEPTLTGEADQ